METKAARRELGQRRRIVDEGDWPAGGDQRHEGSQAIANKATSALDVAFANQMAMQVSRQAALGQLRTANAERYGRLIDQARESATAADHLTTEVQ